MTSHLPRYILLFALLFFIILSPWIDLALARLFYDNGHFAHPTWRFINHHGVSVVRVAFWVSIAFGIFALVSPKWRRWAPAALLFIATYLLSNIAVDGAKWLWNRPRPSTLQEFGGNAEFYPVYQPNRQPVRNHRSFPSRHCTRGFIFLVLYLIGRRHGSRYLQVIGVVMTALVGGLFAIASIAQGRHFCSDTVASLLLIWGLALLLEKGLARFMRKTA